MKAEAFCSIIQLYHFFDLFEGRGDVLWPLCSVSCCSEIRLTFHIIFTFILNLTPELIKNSYRTELEPHSDNVLDRAASNMAPSRTVIWTAA